MNLTLNLGLIRARAGFSIIYPETIFSLAQKNEILSNKEAASLNETHHFLKEVRNKIHLRYATPKAYLAKEKIDLLINPKEIAIDMNMNSQQLMRKLTKHRKRVIKLSDRLVNLS